MSDQEIPEGTGTPDPKVEQAMEAVIKVADAIAEVREALPETPLEEPRFDELPDTPALMEPGFAEHPLEEPVFETEVPVRRPSDFPEPVEEGKLPELPDDTLVGQEAIAQAPEAPEEPPKPAWAGELKPNENVDEPLKVLEEVDENTLNLLARDGSVILSNFDDEELEVLSSAITRDILLKQKERRKLAAAGKAQNYMTAELNGGVLFVTPEENRAVTACQEYMRSLRTFSNSKLLTDGDKWTNAPRRGDRIIAPGVATGKSKDVVARVQQKLGLAFRVNWPFFGSGFSLVIEGPGALEQLALDQRIASEKVEHGRDSTGYVFGAPALYMNRPVVEFALKQVVEGTPGITDVQQLKELLVITDIEPLALAVAASMHPHGYLLERPCLTTHGGCGHVEERRINLRRMIFVRHSRLTDAHWNIMDKRTGLVDSSQIKQYQATMRPEVSRMIELRAGYFIRLRVPTFAQYERIAETWLSTMNRRAKEVSASNATEQEREAYMTKASRIALVMAYGHWVDAILELDPEVDTEPQVTVERLDNTDPEAQFKADLEIDKILESIALDSDLTAKIFEGLENFISQMTIATPCVPKVKCRKCGLPLSGEEGSPHPHLVNVNAVELFFTLLRHKIQKLSA